MTSPLRNSARSPSLHQRTDSSPWMKLCRVSCCVSPATGGKGGKRFLTTLVTTRSARWSTRRPGMLAGASFIAALTVLEHADAPTVVLAYHALARGSPDLTFRWYNITDEQEEILHLTGFIDGTENPPLSEAPEVALIPDGSPGAGGSVVLVQKWMHDAAAFDALPIEEQEKVIGRTKATSTELDEEVRGPQSHVSRTVIEVNGVEQHIFRRNTPFGTATEHGTMFIGFSCDQHRLARMLARMAGAEGGGAESPDSPGPEASYCPEPEGSSLEDLSTTLPSTCPACGWIGLQAFPDGTRWHHRLHMGSPAAGPSELNDASPRCQV